MEPAEDGLGEDGKPVQITPPNMPQWSQPRIGWVTCLGAVVETANALPQWSQPEDRLGDGSRNLSRLMCAYGALRERFGSAAAQD